MNKRLKIITAFLLTLVMAVTGSYAFAGTDMQQADGEDQAAIEVTEEEVPASDDADQAAVEVTEEEALPDDTAVPEVDESKVTLTSEPDAAMEAVGEETVELMALDNVESIQATTINYTSPSYLDLSWSQQYDYPGLSSGCSVLKINVKNSGKLWIDAKIPDSNTAGARIFVGKYDPDSGSVDYSYTRTAYLYGDTKQVRAIGGIDVVPGGSYCVGIESTNNGSIFIRPYVYSYGIRTLPASTYMMAEGYKTSSDGSFKDSTALFKIKPSKTGYIRVYLKEYGYSKSAGYVTLLNYNRYTRSEKLWYYEGSDTSYIAFGVKKGNTYYLKVSGCSGDYDNLYVYRIKYTNYSATSRTNTTKSKAKKLTRQASYISTAVPATGSSGNQWYKFKVTKKRATKFKIDASNIKSGTTKVTVYCGKKKIGTSTLSNGRVNTFSITYGTTYGKAKKGTYYVKVHKSGYASGAYKIRYVK